jgi:hypothetical protein
VTNPINRNTLINKNAGAGSPSPRPAAANVCFRVVFYSECLETRIKTWSEIRIADSARALAKEFDNVRDIIYPQKQSVD